MSADNPATLVLFDVDGTLLLSGGAGVRAMSRAFGNLAGVPDAFAGVPMAGRTDQAIVLDALARHGRDLDGPWMDAFRSAYFSCLREEIARPSSSRRVMPGVRRLLETLVARDAVWLALLTGNFEEGARIKLEHFDLARYFTWGAFADDSIDRNALVPIALRRAVERGAPSFPADRVFVVGDTPADVSCALAAGVRSIGVATGPYDAASLSAAGAHEVFDDLRDVAQFLRVIQP